MSVRKLAQGKYAIDYYPQGHKGKRIRLTFYGSATEAKMYEAELRQNNTGGVAISRINPKVIDIVPEWLQHIKANLSTRYYRDAKGAAKHLLISFGQTQFSRITPSLIDKYKILRGEHKPALNKELSYLRSLLAYAVKHKYAHPLPFDIRGVAYKPPVPQIPRPEDFLKFIEELWGRFSGLKKAATLLLGRGGLSWEELIAFRWEDDYNSQTPEVKGWLEPVRKDRGVIFSFPSNGKPWRSSQELHNCCQRVGLVLLMWQNGLRWDEASHVKWEWIDWSREVIYLKRTKGSQERQAILTEDLQDILLPFKKEAGYVFTSPKTGKPITSIKTVIRLACKRAGIRRFTPHKLRHAFGTYSLEACGNLRSVQVTMGHQSIKSTELYTHVSIEEQRKVIKATQKHTTKGIVSLLTIPVNKK